MKKYNSQLVKLIFCFLLLLPNSAFSIDFFWENEEEVIWEAGKNVYFKYAKLDNDSLGENDQPVSFAKEELEKALSLIKVSDKNQAEEQETLFTQLQMNLLAKHLASGLETATPEQDIVFALKRNASRFFGLKTDQYFIAGRVFYKEGNLNIIIGDYNRPRLEGYEAAYDPTHVGIVAYHFNHGYRTKKSKKYKKVLKEVAGIENKKYEGLVRNNWFVVDVQKAAETAVTIAKTQEKDELDEKRKELRAILGEDTASGTSTKEKAKISKERREMRAEMARMRKQMNQMNNNGQEQSLEERLGTLKALKNKGLISEEEYQLKRKEILKDI